MCSVGSQRFMMTQYFYYGLFPSRFRVYRLYIHVTHVWIQDGVTSTDNGRGWNGVN